MSTEGIIDQWTLIGANIAIIAGLVAEAVWRKHESKKQKEELKSDIDSQKEQIDIQKNQLQAITKELSIMEKSLEVAKKSYEDSRKAYENAAKSYEADVLLRINDDFFFREPNPEIIDRIMTTNTYFGLKRKKRLQ